MSSLRLRQVVPWSTALLSTKRPAAMTRTGPELCDPAGGLELVTLHQGKGNRRQMYAKPALTLRAALAVIASTALLIGCASRKDTISQAERTEKNRPGFEETKAI